MLAWLAEQRIREAQRRGDFNHLPGAHRPLPPDALDSLVPAHLRMAMRVIYNAGGLPSDIILRRDLATLEARISEEEADRMPGSIHQTDADIRVLRERHLELLTALKRRL